MSAILEMQAIEKLLRKADEHEANEVAIVWAFAHAMYKGKDVTDRIRTACIHVQKEWDLLP